VILSKMKSHRSPKKLILLAESIGKDKSLVQGPGGNVSIKTRNGIWVKRSGTWLERARTSEIFYFLPRIKVNGETSYQQNADYQLSIETPFHTLIPSRCVLHVHSVGSLTWGLREITDTTYDVMKKLNLYFAPYIKPGIEIADYITENPNVLKSKGIVLANHGLITWSRTTRGGFRKLMRLEKALMSEAVGIKLKSTDGKFEDRNQELAPLTPDHAVFFSENGMVQEWVQEMKKSILCALDLIPDDQKISYLSSEDVLDLVSWDAEKIRRKLNE
jgi:rhamnose utilization protein RhaD (predicted bifunctional aldolase and dehydrogenase)